MTNHVAWGNGITSLLEMFLGGGTGGELDPRHPLGSELSAYFKQRVR